MNRFTVRVYKVGVFGFFTKSDSFEDYDFTSMDPIEVFAKRLARDGFPAKDGRLWIMPGAIVEVRAS